MRNHLLTVALALFAFALFASAQDATVDQTDDSRAWKEIKRIDYDASRVHHMAAGIPIGGIVIYPLEQDTLGVCVACTVEILPEGDDLRVAFVDKDGKRHDADRNYGIGGPRGNINRAYLFVSPKSCPSQDVREVIFEQFIKTVSADELADLRRTEEQRLAEYSKVSPLGIPIVGKPYPFKLTGLNGNEVSTDKWKGKVIVMDFWATWCGPCVAELPKLKKLYEEYHDRGLEVVGISSDIKRALLTEYVKDNDIRWPQVYMKDLGEKVETALQKTIGLTGIPRYFVIDRDGKLHTDRARGRLAEIIPKLLAK